MSQIDSFTMRAAERGKALHWIVITVAAAAFGGFMARDSLAPVFRAPADLAAIRLEQEAADDERAKALLEIADLRKTQTEAMQRMAQAVEAIQSQMAPRVDIERIERRLAAIDERLDRLGVPALPPRLPPAK